MTQTMPSVLVALLILNSFPGSGATQSNSNPLVRRYKEGEALTYHMKASNQDRTGTIRYEADAKGTAKKDGAGHFIEEFQWSGLSFNRAGGPAVRTSSTAACCPFQ